MTGLEFGLISLFLSFVIAGTVKINTQCPHVDRVRTIEYSEAAAQLFIWRDGAWRPKRGRLPRGIPKRARLVAPTGEWMFQCFASEKKEYLRIYTWHRGGKTYAAKVEG